MKEAITYVGIDWHERRLVLAIAAPEREVEVLSVQNEVKSLQKWAARMHKLYGSQILCVYESGAGGYALQRELTALGIRCEVAAASLIPTANGRLKTDRRDAKKLVLQLRAETLSFVRVPTLEQEALRELTRYRQCLSETVRSTRHRISKMLLRHHVSFPWGRKWTKKYREWLEQVRLSDALSQEVFGELLRELACEEQRLRNLDRRLEDFQSDEFWGPRVRALCCLRGIQTVTAVSLAAELGDVRCFRQAGKLMAWTGLVPSEASSGERKQRGSITLAGNRRVRRLLVESAWHARQAGHRRGAVVKRREGEPIEIVAMAEKSQLRLHSRFSRLCYRGKPSPVAVVAVARELAGTVWAVLREVERQREPIPVGHRATAVEGLVMAY